MYPRNRRSMQEFTHQLSNARSRHLGTAVHTCTRANGVPALVRLLRPNGRLVTTPYMTPESD